MNSGISGERLQKASDDSGKNIIILGPQGSGKGTQAVMLAKEMGISHISTGDIFRAMAKEKTPLAKEVQVVMNIGGLVSDELTNKVVLERLKKDDVKQGYLLDGYPRDLLQAEFLEKIRSVSKCILIDVSDSESIRRITARRVCENCKAGYNIIYIKPKKEGICNACGGRLMTREDDTPEAVKARLKKYHAETEPVIKFYEKKKGVLVRINGEQSIRKVFEDIMKKL